MNVVHTLALFAGAVVACAAGGWNSVRCWSQARHLQDTPSSKIRSAAQGYVELAGLLQSADQMQFGPLTGQPCLWWRYEIERYRTSGRSRRWQTLESGRSEAWLRLADSTGECLIDPRGAQVYPATRQVWEGTLRHPLRNASYGLLDGLFGGRYRYTEERLHVGEYLYAIGEFQTQSPVSQSLDGEQARGAVVREWKADFTGLLRRFDADGNGRLDDEEWRLVQLAARLEAEQRHRQAARQPDWHRLAKPGEAQPFILSSRGKDGAIRHLRRRALISVLVCLAAAGMTTVLLDRLL